MSKLHSIGNLYNDPEQWREGDYHQWKKEVGQRLRLAIKKRYGKRRECEFANEIGVSQGSLSEIINGISAPSALTLFKIQFHTTINISRLLGR